MGKHTKQNKDRGSSYEDSLGSTGGDVEKNKRHDSFARAACEDDDGYDPWSDRVIKEPFWEKDPWD